MAEVKSMDSKFKTNPHIYQPLKPLASCFNLSGKKKKNLSVPQFLYL